MGSTFMSLGLGKTGMCFSHPCEYLDLAVRVYHVCIGGLGYEATMLFGSCYLSDFRCCMFGLSYFGTVHVVSCVVRSHS